MNDAPEIDADHPAPVVEGLVREQIEGRDAGVVADDVDTTEAVESRAREPGDRLRIRNVGRDDERPCPSHAAMRHPLEGAGFDVGQHDAPSPTCRRHAAARAGHDATWPDEARSPIVDNHFKNAA
jgi:hypothetical protein